MVMERLSKSNERLRGCLEGSNVQAKISWTRISWHGIKIIDDVEKTKDLNQDLDYDLNNLNWKIYAF